MEATISIDPDTEVIAKQVLDAAFSVHSELGPGLLESVYETCLAWELEQLGIEVSRQVNVPIRYRDRKLDSGLRLDMLVGGRVRVITESGVWLI